MEWNKSESSELERTKMKDRFAVVFLLLLSLFQIRKWKETGRSIKGEESNQEIPGQSQTIQNTGKEEQS
jgi:hypothetical protein